ncbi:MAG: grasp-with-spasm system ATP-grasp peptide maturase [Crocinitomix sp.]|nr:grasp-with-spasm system ATP-grasp peptide maturase [Crocinitomix sp.]
MVAIMSREDDFSTSEVIEWIKFSGAKVLRLNEKDKLSILKFDVTADGKITLLIEVKGEKYSIDNFNSFWYRRGRLNIDSPKIKLEEINDDVYRDKVKRYLNNEISVIEEYIISLLEEKKSLGSKSLASINKLRVLNEANSCGIKTPWTSVVSDSKSINENRENIQRMVTKPLSDSLYFSLKTHENKDKFYGTYTSLISDPLPEKMFPTLIQEQLDKELELRIFFINESFYSMAIFSQLDKSTSVDFRRYNLAMPNRTTPFKLPLKIEKKLIMLNRKIGLNTGSIDMVVTKENEFVLLEINPVGQFGMVSKPCNYKLEKEVANFLIKK